MKYNLKHKHSRYHTSLEVLAQRAHVMGLPRPFRVRAGYDAWNALKGQPFQDFLTVQFDGRLANGELAFGDKPFTLHEGCWVVCNDQYCYIPNDSNAPNKREILKVKLDNLMSVNKSWTLFDESVDFVNSAMQAHANNEIRKISNGIDAELVAMYHGGKAFKADLSAIVAGISAQSGIKLTFEVDRMYKQTIIRVKGNNAEVAFAALDLERLEVRDFIKAVKGLLK